MAETTRPPIVTILGHVDHGKCVSGDTLIPLPSGEIVKAKDIFETYSRDLNPEILSNGIRFELKKALNIFSFDGEEIVIKKITHLWKLYGPKKLIEVILYSGDKIIVTPEHPFYVFNSDGKIIQRRADELHTEEFVICPKDLPTEFVSLRAIKAEMIQRFKDTGGWVVFLYTQESQKFWSRISKHRICDLISQGLFSTDARGQFQKKRFRISDYIKLGSFLGFSNSELYDFIGTIKNSGNNDGWHTSKRIQLPKTVKHFSYLGYILGSFVGDGSFSNGAVHLHNNDSEIINTYREYLEEIFGVDTKTIAGHTCLLTRNNAGKTLKRFISEVFDVPDNQKSANVQVPQLVQKYRPLLKEFIAGYFDTDGYMSSINHSAEFTSKSNQLIKQLGIVLLSFGIHSSIFYKNGYANLRIANKPYLEIFSKEFNFRLLKKKVSIKEALSRSSVSRIFDYTPLTSEVLSEIKISNDVISYWSNYKKSSGLLTRPFLKNLVSLNLFDFKNNMKAVLNTSVSPVRVRKIEIIDAQDEFVYDFTVEDTHNFVAERTIVHNTTLLDFIRKSNVASREHGGITQHIGAYQVEHNGKLITFIDTPGHAAFEKMRSRGAKVADIAVLVVAIDDGIMPQTIEAIKHIQEAKVSLIVAVNKIDLPGINTKVQLEKIKKQLSDRDVKLEEYGGDVPIVPLSAKTGEGVDKLLEMILLVSELHEIKGDPNVSPSGVVIEANLDKFKGSVATILVRNGTLKKGDSILVGGVKGKVRGMFDFALKSVDFAGPSTPVEVLGLKTVPTVGAVLGEVGEAKKLVDSQSLVDKLKQGDTKTLKVIIKADKQGSLEAIQSSLDKFSAKGGLASGQNEEREVVDVIFSATGDIGEENVRLASTVKAIVIGFNVKVAPNAQKIAETEHVLIRTYNIIYELIEEMEEVVEGLLKVGQLEEVIGRAEILAEFEHGKTEKIAGCKVLEGEIAKGHRIRVVRDGTILGETKIKSMRKVKEEVNKIEKGNECGMLFDPPIDFAIGDFVESFRVI